MKQTVFDLGGIMQKVIYISLICGIMLLCCYDVLIKIVLQELVYCKLIKDNINRSISEKLHNLLSQQYDMGRTTLL